MLQKVIVAIMVALLTFGKQIACSLLSITRYLWLWEFTDSLSLIFDVLILAMIALGLSQLLRVLRLDLCRKLYNHLFLVAVANGVLTTLAPSGALPHVGMSLSLRLVWIIAWLGILAVTICSYCKPQLQLVRHAANGCLLFSPLIVIIFAQLAMLSEWSSPHETDPSLRPPIPKSTATNQTSTPVFVFIFDEWSYRRSFQKGEFLPELINLRRLSAQSCNFQNAWSYAPTTQLSLPALLFQRDQTLLPEDRSAYFQSESGNVSSRDAPSVFRTAKAQGYFTALQGFFFPYAKILGDQVDYSRSISWYSRGVGLWGHMKDKFIYQLHWFSDPLTEPLRNVLEARFQSHRWFAINTQVREGALRLLDECPANTLAFFHWPLPHGPFVMNEDGSYRVPYSISEVLYGGIPSTVEDYHRHLKYLDVIVGQIVAHLKAAGKYDGAMIVMTSDHSWRHEPEKFKGRVVDLTEVDFRKVPLLIKFPGQQSAHTVDKTVYNHLALRPLIDFVLRSKVEERSALEAIDLLEELSTPSGSTSRRPRLWQ
ncbi:MAG: sulfatase-like hydrolase/transferase [Verrucomicrobia bacterium]|nr:sulfatase-like hydrolase/transferase [Verrucomicrobiota bacterium]